LTEEKLSGDKMSDVVISVENLSKTYQLGVIGTGTLRGDMQRWWARLRGLPDPSLIIDQTDHGNRDGETIWALADVNFEIKRGEAVGIIGRNGAGKSTLLKILSRVTAPSSGRVRVKGNIASLLEVGTGFHPELTGRENIFLNGAILGMSRREIARKLDEIVDFSGVEKFIDTPVKRYSSGMYVRLAFAVAAHLESDILVVDEVLAVGDAEFQRKCLGKMQDVSRGQGRTVLFVSHNMGMINSLCNRAILLRGGRIFFSGGTASAISQYYSNGINTPFFVDYSQSGSRIGDQSSTLLLAQIEDEMGKVTGEININAGFTVKMKYRLHNAVPQSSSPNFHFYNSQGQCVFITSGERSDHVSGDAVYEAACHVPAYLLNNDTYFISIALTFTHNGIHVSYFEQGALSVVIRDPLDETVDNERQGYSGHVPGVVRPKLDWKVRIVK
jgi:lipopolysaccharide transport system ATP-binding protein